MKMLKAVILKEWRQVFCGGSWKHLAGCACAIWFGSFLLSLGQFSQGKLSGFPASGRLFLWWIGVVLFSFAAENRARKECGDAALDPMLTAPLSPWALVLGQFLALFSVILFYTVLILPAFFLPQEVSLNFTAETLGTLLKIMLLLGGIGAALAPGAFGKSSGSAAALLTLGLFFTGNALLFGTYVSQAQFQQEVNCFAVLLWAVLLLLCCAAAGARTPETQDRYGALKFFLLLFGLFLPEMGGINWRLGMDELYEVCAFGCGLLLLVMGALERLTPAKRTFETVKKHRFLYALYPFWGGSGMTFLLAAVVYGKMGLVEGDGWVFMHKSIVLLFFYPILTALIRCFSQEKPWKILLGVCGCAGVIGMIGFFGNLPLLLRFTNVFSDCDEPQYEWFYNAVAAADVALLLFLIVFPRQKARRNG